MSSAVVVFAAVDCHTICGEFKLRNIQAANHSFGIRLLLL